MIRTLWDSQYDTIVKIMRRTSSWKTSKMIKNLGSWHCEGAMYIRVHDTYHKPPAPQHQHHPQQRSKLVPAVPSRPPEHHEEDGCDCSDANSWSHQGLAVTKRAFRWCLLDKTRKIVEKSPKKWIAPTYLLWVMKRRTRTIEFSKA